MRPPARPKLKARDAMVLIGAGAVGLAVLRWFMDTFQVYFFIFRAGPGDWGPRLLVLGATEILSLFVPFVAAWTMVVPLLRLRRPRPPFWRIARQPGTAACLAAIVGMGWGALALAVPMLLDRMIRGRLISLAEAWLWKFGAEELLGYVGLAVASAWISLALTGCWRPVPDWIDRLGRALGVSWLIIGLAWAFRRYVALL